LLKLPKDVVADPRHEALLHLLTAHEAPLWEGGKLRAPTLAPTPALLTALRAALVAGQASQGLELITEKLAAEQKGLDAARAKAPSSAHAARASRFLFIADDGATRFYRDCEALLVRYPQRLVVIRLQLAGEALGEALLGSVRMVRSVLVHDKTAGARALLALLPS
jgi:hypothetical protein